MIIKKIIIIWKTLIKIKLNLLHKLMRIKLRKQNTNKYYVNFTVKKQILEYQQNLDITSILLEINVIYAEPN